ncbi:putative quinol monooxygenase [Vibrio splendidus]|uniref:putative quinol monooxygenase n=1 Tax=Vibrio splendidus TaxID=29497 RepID=UPI00148CB4FD|nr:putative quinol monooxygenase [Vibrio splendidus]NOJ08757.1 antibiotic biosynthesis monooxygenase [Vibrio splendidus]
MIHLTAAFTAQKGQEENLRKLLTDMLEPTRNESGNIRYSLFQETEDNTKFLFQEQFSDQQALDTHCQAPHFASLLKNLEGVLAEEPNITFYNAVES